MTDSTTTSNVAAVKKFMELWSARPVDADALADVFTEDAVYQSYVPGGTVISGRAAIRAELERVLGFATDTECVTLTLVADGSTVVTERADTFTMNGHQVTQCLVAIFDMKDGRISGWREYFDTMDVVRKLGMTYEEFEGAANSA